MTQATLTSFPPVARKEYLDRLAALPPRPGFTLDSWTSVHDEVQDQLACLEAEVRQKIAKVQVDAGRTKGDKFFLFSYRTFSIPDSAIDPVVAGMAFTPAHEGVTVKADVSGEQTGDWISAASTAASANSREELLATARASARTLLQSAEAIVAALKDPRRKVE